MRLHGKCLLGEVPGQPRWNDKLLVVIFPQLESQQRWFLSLGSQQSIFIRTYA